MAHRICPKRKGHKKAVRVKLKGVDIEATKARNFKNPKSRVMLDGREILLKPDYDRRVREVQERSGYRCEVQREIIGVPARQCRAPSCGHPHHVVKRSKLRDDRLANLLDVCEYHASAVHPEHQTRFGEEKVNAS